MARSGAFDEDVRIARDALRSLTPRASVRSVSYTPEDRHQGRQRTGRDSSEVARIEIDKCELLRIRLSCARPSPSARQKRLIEPGRMGLYGSEAPANGMIAFS